MRAAYALRRAHEPKEDCARRFAPASPEIAASRKTVELDTRVAAHRLDPVQEFSSGEKLHRREIAGGRRRGGKEKIDEQTTPLLVARDKRRELS